MNVLGLDQGAPHCALAGDESLELQRLERGRHHEPDRLELRTKRIVPGRLDNGLIEALHDHGSARAPRNQTKWRRHTSAERFLRLQAFGAGGLAILASIAQEERQEIIQRVAPNLAPFGNLTEQAVTDACLQTREQGMSLIRNKINLGVTAVGHPFRDPVGQSVGALSVAALSQRMTAAASAAFPGCCATPAPTSKDACAPGNAMAGRRADAARSRRRPRLHLNRAG
jgi:hypothetical protein